MKKGLIFIFLIALLGRFLFLVFYDVRVRKDAASYDLIAWSLAKGHGYVGPDGSITAGRAPGYPFFLSLVYRLFGHNYKAVKIIQCILGAISCILVYMVANEVFDRKVGLLAGFLVAVNIGFIAICRMLLSENLSIFFLSLLLFCLIRALKRDSLFLFVVSGFLLGFLILIKSMMVLLVPILALVVLLFWRTKDLRRRIVMGSVIISIAFIVLMPWAVRNCIVFQRFVPLSTHLGETFYAAYKPNEGKIFGTVARNDPLLEYAVKNFDEADRSRFMFIQTLKFIRQNPKKVFLTLLPLKLMVYLGPLDWELLGGRGLYNFSYVFIFPLFAFGIWHLRGKEDINVLILSLPFFYLLGISLVFSGPPRFRLQVETVMVIFASYSMVHLFLNRLGLYKAVLVLSAWGCFNVACFVFSEQIRFFSKGILEGAGLW